MMFTPKNLTALPLLHFPQNSIAILQYFNELESYWNIAIYCNNSINCNLLQYDAIKQRSAVNIPFLMEFTTNEHIENTNVAVLAESKPPDNGNKNPPWPDLRK